MYFSFFSLARTKLRVELEIEIDSVLLKQVCRSICIPFAQAQCERCDGVNSSLEFVFCPPSPINREETHKKHQQTLKSKTRSKEIENGVESSSSLQEKLSRFSNLSLPFSRAKSNEKELIEKREENTLHVSVFARRVHTSQQHHGSRACLKCRSVPLPLNKCRKKWETSYTVS